MVRLRSEILRYVPVLDISVVVYRFGSYRNPPVSELQYAGCASRRAFKYVLAEEGGYGSADEGYGVPAATGGGYGSSGIAGEEEREEDAGYGSAAGEAQSEDAQNE